MGSDLLDRMVYLIHLISVSTKPRFPVQFVLKIFFRTIVALRKDLGTGRYCSERIKGGMRNSP